jgi:hypothetical protein
MMSGGDFNEIATIGADLAAYNDTGLSGGVTCVYRVRAYNADGNSAYSNDASATTSSADPLMNLAKNKPVAASTAYNGKPAENAVDGSTSTYWRSGGVSKSKPIAWLRVNLGVPQSGIGRCVIRWKDGYYAKSYEVQVSHDDVDWTTVYSTTDGSKKVQDFTFPQTTAPYVRLYLKKNNKGSYRMSEFEVYSGPAPGASKRAAETVTPATTPSTITLAQNHPNPFNPSTAITFALPQAMRVTLKVYNITGQEVATLLDGDRSTGSHEIMFNASRLPSGNYFVVLQAGGEKLVRRIVLMK